MRGAHSAHGIWSYFMNARFHFVPASCKHHSPTSMSRACGRAAGAKIGDTYPFGAHSGQLSDVLYQPEIQEDVFKVLLMNGFLGNYIWTSGNEHL